MQSQGEGILDPSDTAILLNVLVKDRMGIVFAYDTVCCFLDRFWSEVRRVDILIMGSAPVATSRPN